MKKALIIFCICFNFLFLLSCTEKDAFPESPKWAVYPKEDTLLQQATWYLYAMNCNESSRLVNLVNDEGRVVKPSVPIVTVPFKLGAIEVNKDTATYSFELRKYMDPAGSYNALFYEIAFVKGELFSGKSDDNFVFDLRGIRPDSNALFWTELKKYKDKLTPFLKKEYEIRDSGR